MSTPAIGEPHPDGSSIISHFLRAAKKELQYASIVATLAQDEADVLEREASDVLSLIRSWRNKPTPISRVPPEVLTLIPDFWDGDDGEKAVITLTHVCRAWREMFTSRSSLWTNFRCANADKTRVYLERSKSSPINLCLEREDGLLPHDPLLQIAPRAISRLKNVIISTTSDHLEDVTDYLVEM